MRGHGKDVVRPASFSATSSSLQGNRAMYFPVAQATCVALMTVALVGCQSGVHWPWAKKEAAVSQAYPSGATPAGSYSNQANANVQLPTTTTQPYNVGNNYAPGGNTSAATGGVYPEAATAATAATYPVAGSAATTAGSAYGAASLRWWDGKLSRRRRFAEFLRNARLCRCRNRPSRSGRCLW